MPFRSKRCLLMMKNRMVNNKTKLSRSNKKKSKKRENWLVQSTMGLVERSDRLARDLCQPWMNSITHRTPTQAWDYVAMSKEYTSHRQYKVASELVRFDAHVHANTRTNVCTFAG